MYLTIPRAAARVGLSPHTLRQARDRGEIIVVRVGQRWERVRLEDVLAWIEARRLSTEHETTG